MQSNAVDDDDNNNSDNDKAGFCSVVTMLTLSALCTRTKNTGAKCTKHTFKHKPEIQQNLHILPDIITNRLTIIHNNDTPGV